jgi:hypothetical protein
LDAKTAPQGVTIACEFTTSAAPRGRSQGSRAWPAHGPPKRSPNRPTCRTASAQQRRLHSGRIDRSPAGRRARPPTGDPAGARGNRAVMLGFRSHAMGDLGVRIGWIEGAICAITLLALLAWAACGNVAFGSPHAVANFSESEAERCGTSVAHHGRKDRPRPPAYAPPSPSVESLADAHSEAPTTRLGSGGRRGQGRRRGGYALRGWRSGR